MFYGEYQHTLDQKSRVIIPSKFRDELGENFIITKGLDGCLFVYPVPEWSSIVEKLKSLPFTDKDVRAFSRFFFSGASECELDKQGRVLLPSNLRAYAELKKEICIIGVSTKLEIWDKEKWDSCNEDFNNPENLAEKMSMLGI